MEKILVYSIKIIVFIVAMFVSGKVVISFLEKRGKKYKFFDVQILFASSIIAVLITKAVMVILKRIIQ